MAKKTKRKLTETAGAVRIMPQFDFGGALSLLKAGKLVDRAGWRETIHLILDIPVGPDEDDTGFMTLPFICVVDVRSGDRFPWIPTHADMLAEDWEEVEPEGPLERGAGL